MKPGLNYTFHHFGIPSAVPLPHGIHSEKVGMYTEDNPGRFRGQWHYFTDDSPLHELLRTVPHVAFKVDDLAAAIEGEEVILGPYEPIDDYRVAVINDAGVPIELIQTDFDDETLWARAKSRQGSIYR
ncbi:VOC family protein [Aeromonas jandaei]|uniref:VOC family protein n=1 Tax=Aeromonas jandaei TaxID=650 RepID=UPI003BA084E5